MLFGLAIVFQDHNVLSHGHNGREEAEDRYSLSRANSAFWEAFWSFFSAPPVCVCAVFTAEHIFRYFFLYGVPLTATTPTPQKCAPVNRPKCFDDRRSFWPARLNLNRCWWKLSVPPRRETAIHSWEDGPSTIERAFSAGRYNRISTFTG